MDISSLRAPFLVMLSAIGFGWPAQSLCAEGTTVFSDQFDNGSRSHWFNANGSAGLAVAAGKLKAINSNALLLAHFPPVTLEVGDSLTIKFLLSLTAVANVSGGLRLGVFGSEKGVKVTRDGFGLNGFSHYQGYRLYANAGMGGSRIEKRDPAADSLITGSGWSPLGAGARGLNLEACSSYPVSITIARTESGLETAFSVNGVTLKAADPDAGNFTFDTLALNNNKSAGNGDLTLDDVSVTSQTRGTSPHP